MVKRKVGSPKGVYLNVESEEVTQGTEEKELQSHLEENSKDWGLKTGPGRRSRDWGGVLLR